jgi:hypothetical protein
MDMILVIGGKHRMRRLTYTFLAIISSLLSLTGLFGVSINAYLSFRIKMIHE